MTKQEENDLFNKIQKFLQSPEGQELIRKDIENYVSKFSNIKDIK